MATRSCKHCGNSYAASDTRDTGFCSDRCFSRHALENKPASRLGWFLQLGVFLGGIALWVWHVDAAVALARHAPQAAPLACRFLAWCGGPALDRLIEFAGDEGDLRRDALAALEHISDPDDARKRLKEHLPELKKWTPKMDRSSRGLLLVAYGRAGLEEEFDTIVAGLQEPDLQVHAARALRYLKHPKGAPLLLELLGQWEWQLKHKPEVIVAALEALAVLRDDDRRLCQNFVPFLGHDKPAVRAAAALGIAEHAADYGTIKKSLATAPHSDRGEIKERLTRLETALTAVKAAGDTEKDPDTKARMAEVVATMAGESASHHGAGHASPGPDGTGK